MYYRVLPDYLFIRFIGLCILLIGLCTSCEAQDTTLKPGTDTALIRKLIKSGLRESDADSAIRLFNKTLQLSIAGNFLPGISKSLYGIGFKNEAKGDISNALIYYRKGLVHSFHTEDSVSFYCQIGYLFLNLFDYEQAAESLYLGLQVQQKHHTVSPLTVNLYNGLAIINSDLNQNDKAIYYLTQGEKVARQLNLNYNLCQILTDKEYYYIHQNKIDSANAASLELLAISSKNNYKDMVVTANQELGALCIATRQYEKAIWYLDSAIFLAKKQYNYNPIYIECSYSIGEALYLSGNYKKALATVIPVIQKADSLNIKGFNVNGYKTLVGIYRATGQYKKALDGMDTLSKLKDSLFSLEKTEAVNHTEIKYKTAEKDRQLTQNQLLIAQQNSKITRKNTLIAAAAGGVLLLLVISAGIYRNGRQKQRLQVQQIRSLEQEKKILEQKNKIDILKAAVQGEDNERSRIARELHDGIGGMLSAAIIRLSAMHNENEAITQIKSYNEAMGILSEMGDEIRKTAHNLMPEVLLKQNLPEAVRTYCDNIQDGSNLQIDFQSYGSFGNLSENFKLNVYRIVQELLKNIVQHAQAGNALVQLHENENMLTLTVEDNGVGFNINETKNGIGLHNLQTRVSSLDGNMTIRSGIGKGTSVFIEFELTPPAPLTEKKRVAGDPLI